MMFTLILFIVTINQAMAGPASRLSVPKPREAHSAYDLAWQALHIGAAAACRGTTPTGGSGPWVNAVLNRNSRGPKSCTQLCRDSGHYTHCDAEVSIYGNVGKATENGQEVGWFYNYGCDNAYLNVGGEEAAAPEDNIVTFESASGFSFCCCRK